MATKQKVGQIKVNQPRFVDVDADPSQFEMVNFYSPAAGALKASEAPPQRSFARAVGDLGLQFAGGAVSGVRMMADIAGADNKVSGTLRYRSKRLCVSGKALPPRPIRPAWLKS